MGPNVEASHQDGAVSKGSRSGPSASPNGAAALANLVGSMGGDGKPGQAVDYQRLLQDHIMLLARLAETKKSAERMKEKLSRALKGKEAVSAEVGAERESWERERQAMRSEVHQLRQQLEQGAGEAAVNPRMEAQLKAAKQDAKEGQAQMRKLVETLILREADLKKATFARQQLEAQVKKYKEHAAALKEQLVEAQQLADEAEGVANARLEEELAAGTARLKDELKETQDHLGNLQAAYEEAVRARSQAEEQLKEAMEDAKRHQSECKAMAESVARWEDAHREAVAARHAVESQLKISAQDAAARHEETLARHAAEVELLNESLTHLQATHKDVCDAKQKAEEDLEATRAELQDARAKAQAAAQAHEQEATGQRAAAEAAAKQHEEAIESAMERVRCWEMVHEELVQAKAQTEEQLRLSKDETAAAVRQAMELSKRLEEEKENVRRWQQTHQEEVQAKQRAEEEHRADKERTLAEHHAVIESHEESERRWQMTLEEEAGLHTATKQQLQASREEARVFEGRCHTVVEKYLKLKEAYDEAIQYTPRLPLERAPSESDVKAAAELEGLLGVSAPLSVVVQRIKELKLELEVAKEEAVRHEGRAQSLVEKLSRAKFVYDEAVAESAGLQEKLAGAQGEARAKEARIDALLEKMRRQRDAYEETAQYRARAEAELQVVKEEGAKQLARCEMLTERLSRAKSAYEDMAEARARADANLQTTQGELAASEEALRKHEAMSANMVDKMRKCKAAYEEAVAGRLQAEAQVKEMYEQLRRLKREVASLQAEAAAR